MHYQLMVRVFVWEQLRSYDCGPSANHKTQVQIEVTDADPSANLRTQVQITSGVAFILKVRTYVSPLALGFNQVAVDVDGLGLCDLSTSKELGHAGGSPNAAGHKSDGCNARDKGIPR